MTAAAVSSLREQTLIALAISAVTAISFFWFPGHTILLSDTQVYIPILEHLADPLLLTRDPMVTHPHVTFTLYDEAALTLRRLTGLSFEQVLLLQQVLYRGLGIFGLFLVGRGAGLSAVLSLTATVLVSLGALVNGPAVLTVEFEPVPRGFALPLILLSLGCLSFNRKGFAAGFATAAWAYHPPTAMPYWLLLLALTLWERRWRDLMLLLAGPVLIALSALGQTSSPDQVDLFTRIDPELESIQRMRASYNWVETWIGGFWIHYLVLFAAAFAATWRLFGRLRTAVRWAFAALLMTGCLCIPLSWLLLEKGKWLVAAQYQPGRYLLFISLLAALCCALAGLQAANRRRVIEAACFLFIPFAVPLEPDLLDLSGIRLALAIVLCLACAFSRSEWVLATVALSAFALYPTLGRVVNFAPVDTAELAAVIQWARESTPKHAIFQFADVRRGLQPGVFRARAHRAIYADWKAGGQANFIPSFAQIWAERWKQVERPQSLQRYRELGIDYVVFGRGKAPGTPEPVFSNSQWLVYRLRQ